MSCSCKGSQTFNTGTPLVIHTCIENMAKRTPLDIIAGRESFMTDSPVPGAHAARIVLPTKTTMAEILALLQ